MQENSTHTVYVLQNKEGLLYKGVTTNIKQRLWYHNNGLGHWTKGKGPWRLIYKETFVNKTEALQRERFLKSGKGRALLSKINTGCSAVG